MAYSDKVVEHYENPRNVGSFDKGDDDVGHRHGGRTGLRRRNEAADQGQPGHRPDRGRTLHDLRLRLGHCVQLAGHRMGQRQDAGPGAGHQEHPDRAGTGAAAGEDPLLHPGRRRHQGRGAGLQGPSTTRRRRPARHRRTEHVRHPDRARGQARDRATSASAARAWACVWA